MSSRVAHLLPKLPIRGSATVALGLCVIVLIWAGIALKYVDDTRDDANSADRTARNFAMVFEENVLRSIGEIDKALLYLRRTIETHRGTVSYPEIVNTTDVLSEIIVQVAIIDADGVMRATNVGPQPPPPTYLGDREHFRIHKDTGADNLFISKPVIGRASGKWSVQFSRRFSGPDGRFAGVVVASLDPGHLTKFYDRIEFGSTASIALIGGDGIVRSSGGSDGGFQLGQNLAGTELFERMKSGRRDVIFLDRVGLTEPQRIAIRQIRGQPLWVSVGLRESEIYKDSNATLRLNIMLGAVLTLIAAGAIAALLKVQAKQAQAEAHVRRLASEDPLTDLPNRRLFGTALDTALERRLRHDGDHGSDRLAVLMLDLDRFKLVNDTLGHRMGDRLLQEVAARLKAVLRRDDLLARLGGDEFAILIPALGAPDYVDALAERIVDAFAEPFKIDGHDIRSSVSIGVAICPDHGRDADELMVAADLALYAVKAGDRGRYIYFNKAMNEAVTARREMETDLQLALEREELSLEFQPIIDAATGRIVSCEALARWDHPIKGRIPPTVFISLAEDSGLIRRLGEWALVEACTRAALWPPSIRVAVNLSPVQLAAGNVADSVMQALARSGLPAGRLELEITEGIFLEQNESTLGTLARLRGHGVRIAMDDFGTGYSSLSYLRSFPFDKIKVDRAFVSSLGQGGGQQAIVKAVIDIARALGMKTTAEGVETVVQQELLTQLGCDELQGYCFSRPVPADLLPGLIARWDRERPTLAA